MMDGMMGCEKFKQLCVPANAKVAGCHTGIPKLITTKQVVSDTAEACTVSTMYMYTHTPAHTDTHSPKS